MHRFKTLKTILFLFAFYFVVVVVVPLRNSSRVLSIHRAFDSINDLTMIVHIEYTLYYTNAQTFKVPKKQKRIMLKFWLVIVNNIQIFIFNFFLILCKFQIMHLNPTPQPIPPFLPSTLETSLAKEKKSLKINKNIFLKKIAMAAAICHSVSHRVSFCLNSFTYKCALQ